MGQSGRLFIRQSLIHAGLVSGESSARGNQRAPVDGDPDQVVDVQRQCLEIGLCLLNESRIFGLEVCDPNVDLLRQRDVFG